MSTLKTNNIQHVDRSDPSIIINTDGSVNIAGTMTYEDVTNVDAVGIITGRSLINAQKQIHVGTGVSVKAGGINVTAGITTVQDLQAQGDVSIVDTIYHSGDTNTKIRFPSADTISFETGGTERLSIESNGTFAFGNVTPGGNPAAKNVFLCIGDSDSGIVQDGDGQIEIFANDAEIVNFNAVDGATFTGNITIPDKIIHTGDTNTAIRFPANDTITAETAGSERIRITSAGLVGINTDSPTVRLEVIDSNVGRTWSPTSQTELLVERNGNCLVSIIGSTSSNSMLCFGDTDDENVGNIDYDHADNSMRFTTNASEAVRIDSSGKMGLGTNSPSHHFHLSNNTNTDERLAVVNSNTGSSARAAVKVQSDSSTLDIYATSAAYSGVTGWDDAAVLSTGSGTSGGLILNTQATSSAIKFQTQTTERMRITHEGMQIKNSGAGGGIGIVANATTSEYGLVTTNANRSGAGDLMMGVGASWNGDSVAQIDFRTGDDTSNKDNGRIAFYTQSSSGGGLVERMLIDETGYVTKSNIPCFSYKGLGNTQSASRMTSDGDMLFTSATISSSHYDNSNGRFTAPVAGKYYFQVNALLDNDANAGNRVVRLKVNGSIITTIVYHYFDDTNAGQYYHVSGGALLSLSKDDYVTFFGSEGWHVGVETNVSGFLIG